MKKSFYTLLVVISVLSLFVTLQPILAGRSKPMPRPSVPEHNQVISSVTATSITVTENKTTKTFTITQFTEINVNGQRATVADLKPGMKVVVALGTDSTKASRINASGK